MIFYENSSYRPSNEEGYLNNEAAKILVRKRRMMWRLIGMYALMVVLDCIEFGPIIPDYQNEFYP
jgi:hypothetical protein